MCGLPPSCGLRQRVPGFAKRLYSRSFSTVDPMIVDCQQFVSEILSQQESDKKILDLFIVNC
jgi:hypothetical protein